MSMSVSLVLMETAVWWGAMLLLNRPMNPPAGDRINILRQESRRKSKEVVIMNAILVTSSVVQQEPFRAFLSRSQNLKAPTKQHWTGVPAGTV